jgi:hypothetical protein
LMKAVRTHSSPASGRDGHQFGRSGRGRRRTTSLRS